MDMSPSSNTRQAPDLTEYRSVPSLQFVAILALVILVLSPPAGMVHSETGEEEPSWLVSHFYNGALSVTTDSGASQWEGAKMLTIDDPDATLMSINNGTYFLILVQTEFNSTMDKAGVALSFAPLDANGTTEIWSWTQNQFSGPAEVKSIGDLSGGTLSVVLGSPTESAESGVRFAIGTPYADLIKVATWSDGAGPQSAIFKDSAPIGFELVPYMDHYPKLPLFYSVVIIAAGIGFLFLEDRKYRRPRA